MKKTPPGSARRGLSTLAAKNGTAGLCPAVPPLAESALRDSRRQKGCETHSGLHMAAEEARCRLGQLIVHLAARGTIFSI